MMFHYSMVSNIMLFLQPEADFLTSPIEQCVPAENILI